MVLVSFLMVLVSSRWLVLVSFRLVLCPSWWLVASSLMAGGCPPWRCALVPRQHIADGAPSGYARHSSARRALSRPNRSFRVKATNTITLIISYLDFDFRMYFYIMG